MPDATVEVRITGSVDASLATSAQETKAQLSDIPNRVAIPFADNAAGG